MANAGERLAAVQYRGHLAIDALYLPLAEAVEALVLRAAVTGADGVSRLTAFGRTLALSGIGAELDRVLADLVHTVQTAIVAAEVAADPTDPNAATMAALLSNTEIRSSLARNRPSVLRQVDALLVRGISGNVPAATVAKWVRDYFSPWFATRRDAQGNLLRDGRLGAVRSWPGEAGMASQAPRGLMLTLTTAAHDRGIRRFAVREDKFLRFHVSHKHLEIDECDRLERQDIGYGHGIYPPDQFPAVPRHPRCRCWAEPVDRPRFYTKSESVPA